VYRINSLVILLIAICCGLVQATALDHISINGVRPDLFLITVIFFSLSRTRSETIRSAVACGIIKDITSLSVLGSHTVSFILIGFLLHYHQKKFYKELAFTQITLASLAYLFSSLLILSINMIASNTYSSYYPFLNIILRGAAFTGLVSPLTFFLLSKTLKVNLISGL